MTIKFNKFELHSAFQYGKLNEDFFVDLPNLTPQQQSALSAFLGGVVREEALPGKNTPSWLTDQDIKIPFTDAYEEGNYWHYHSGPYGDARVRAMTFNLNYNARGMTSDAVIHYQKLDDGTVLVVGFSPRHDPFPRSDEPHHNPLFTSE